MINLENFTFKVGGCIGTAMRNLYDSTNSVVKFDIFLTTNFSFDEVSLKSDVKVSWNHFFNVRVILVEANVARSHLDLSNSPFAVRNLADFAHFCP